MPTRQRHSQSPAEGSESPSDAKKIRLDTFVSEVTFMTLPREIRDHIYDFLIPAFGPIKTSSCGRRSALLFRHGRLVPGVAGLDLLRVSSSVNTEFSERIYACVFHLPLHLEGANVFDLDRMLPPKPARSHIRFLLVEISVFGRQALIMKRPKLEALSVMTGLRGLELAVNMFDDQAPVATPAHLTNSDLEDNMILNGITTQVIRSAPTTVRIGYNERNPSTLPSKRWCSVPNVVLDNIHQSQVSMLNGWTRLTMVPSGKRKR